ncbi:MAG: monovalent cation/H+ antiporter complex subunit F [Pseudomonadota bacterium]
MSMAYVAAALFLLLNIAVGLVRVAKGPTTEDLILAAQLFGSTGVAIVLLLALGLDMPDLFDVALVFAVLSATMTVVFAILKRQP